MMQSSRVLSLVAERRVASKDVEPSTPCIVGQAPESSRAHREHPENEARPVRASAHRHSATHKIGPYDAEGVLGNGSHGCVYKVRDLDLDRLVALKICALESRAAADALMAEARILAKLSHPNIVTVHGTGTHEGDVYFVMELVDGLTLSKYAFQAGEEPVGAARISRF